jgi:RNA-directed DNA polymerase
MLAGRWTVRGALNRVAEALGDRPRWLMRVVGAIVRSHADPERDTDEDELTLILLRTPRFANRVTLVAVRSWFFPQLDARIPPSLPAWTTTKAVATALDLEPGRLDWYADLRGMERRCAPEHRRYRYRWVPKRTGGYRLLEAPRPGLKRAQRVILDALLSLIEPHRAAVGFRPGGSVLAHAALHAGKRCVLRMDLQDFFGSTRRSAVERLFAGLGYRRSVSRRLAGICTNTTPDVVRFPPEAPLTPAGVRSAQRAIVPHLPQGAPTSPALANLCVRRLDQRLAGLAAVAGLTYSRYADDLAFSGDISPRAAEHLAVRVAAIALEEGYEVNHRKTRVMPASQRQEVTGIVVNQAPGVSRRERERLEAILHRCVHRGPAGQNREGHTDFRAWLQGRIGWVEQVNPRHATKLRALFAAISWDGATAARPG